jgi:hypothetical protein
MLRFTALLLLAVGLTGCDAINTVKDGFKHSKAVESDLEATLGSKPGVGFNWTNGRLTQVTVTFPRLLEAKPLRELAEAVRAAIGKEFQQQPDNIVLSFVLEKSSSGKTAQADTR